MLFSVKIVNYSPPYSVATINTMDGEGYVKASVTVQAKFKAITGTAANVAKPNCSASARLFGKQCLMRW